LERFVNRNTILAFVLIIVSIKFFTSRFYYEKVLRQPFPVAEKVIPEKEPGKKEQGDIKREQDPVLGDELAPVLAQKTAALQPDTTADSIQADTIWVETDKLICGIYELGGILVSIRAKEFTNQTGKNIKNDAKKSGDFIELIPQKGIGGLGLNIDNGNFDTRIFNYTGDQNTVRVNTEQGEVLEFKNTLSDGSTITKKFTFHKNEYKIGYTISYYDLDGKKVETRWKCGINESESAGGKSMQYDPRLVHLYSGSSVDHIQMKKRGAEEQTGYYNWVALTSKYFMIAIIPEKKKDADINIEAFEVRDTTLEDTKNKVIDYGLAYTSFATGNEESYWIYAGPSQLDEMKKYNIGLQKVLFKGYTWFFFADKWFPPLCEFVLWLLIWLQKYVADYGVVIILLTIILKIVTYPLTQSSTKSMSKMKDIQPKINKIREKYKNNARIMNQKIMEFYKEEGVNPLGGMGGCLPMLLQMPIMISLFIVLRKAIELRGQGTFLIPWITDLSKAEALFPLGFNIPFYGENFALLPALMAILMFYQNKMTIKDPNQIAMVYVMPVMMLVMFNNFPSGLSLYFTFSTALQLIQQIIIEKKKKKTAQ